ncbi:nuclear RNA export factor 1-like [Hylaeus anthracinus]|uniref:nuclear RNA export factor 1-like n=1 Tax=Hylaeus volcanicus TaxID=313075 RepID=UPI0023B83637|nr:nuclear RNA export factor 1-like [Hylaeus volcanicus]XP_054005739.1 nuclear RNA export factor 1-like [Hylaeus anthracinus]
MSRKAHKSAWVGRGGRQPDDKHYYGHDVRVQRNHDGLYHGSRPKVTFKQTSSRPLRRSLRMACLDDDVQMASSSNNNSGDFIISRREWGGQRGRVSPLPMRAFRGGKIPSKIRQIITGEATCYKIVIPQGHKFEKDYIINNLLSYIAPTTFIPIMYRIGGNESSFYIDDQRVALDLSRSNHKITTMYGFKLHVNVMQPGYPYCEIDNKLKERLKQAMAKRYVNETNALDLSKFHLDPDLVADYFYTLSRPLMLKTVLDIVSDCIPNLEALNLDANKLQMLTKLNILSKKFPKLKILYIGDNKIKDIYQLDSLKELQLEELKLTGNPVCNKYEFRQNDYISDVRKRFPKLLRLDGTDLPKPIIFDVADDGNKMPPPQRMFVTNAKIQGVASQFLQQYFLIFDSENRQPLLDAYDEHACFSMTISYSQNANKLNGYYSENRNLYRINESNKRQKLLKQGRLPVVSFISEMPRTSHYLNTFTMDISLVTDGMMLITVTGLFKELGKKEQPVRFFNRTFIIVPEGGGYCIRNEQLHLNNPTDSQLKNLNTQLETQLLTPPAPSQAPSTSNVVAKPAVPVQLPEEVKQQMTLTLSQQTNMNLEWSLKCLEEVQWNYDNALSAFQEFFKLGQIPPEAFNK